MIIAVDAGALSSTDPRLQVGVWRYSYELIRALRFIDRSKCFRLYSFAPLFHMSMDTLEGNCRNIIISPSTGYMALRLPLEVAIHPPHVFLGLSQALPWGYSEKNIGFIYDLGFLTHPRNYQGSYEKLKKQTENLVKRAHAIVTISNAMKANIHEIYGYPMGKIYVAYPGISHVFRKRYPTMHYPYPYFLFVGSLRKGKCIPQLLDTFFRAKMRGRLPHHLILAGGDFWPDREIAKVLDQSKLARYVHLFGHVADLTLARLYRGATAFITLSESEGFCIPVAESFASGCPVIASDIPAIREVIGKNGMLVNPDKREEGVQALINVAKHPSVRNTLSRMGIARSRAFTWDKAARVVSDIIRS